jgi:hypothetical protein
MRRIGLWFVYHCEKRFVSLKLFRHVVVPIIVTGLHAGQPMRPKLTANQPLHSTKQPRRLERTKSLHYKRLLDPIRYGSSTWLSR